MSWWTFKGDAKNLFGLPEKGKKQATPKPASPDKQPPLKPLVQIQSNKIAEIESNNRLFFKTRSWTSNKKARATSADKLFLKRKLAESRATKLEPEYSRVNMKQVSNAKTKQQVEKLKSNLQKWNETLAERSIRVSVLDTTLQVSAVRLIAIPFVILNIFFCRKFSVISTILWRLPQTNRKV
jgi:hypothetical protein